MALLIPDKRVVLHAGTAAHNGADTPKQGEIRFVSDIPCMVVGDGRTVGGLKFVPISYGTAAPVTTPTMAGLIFVDTTGGAAYIAVGTSSSADWKQIT